MIQNKKENFMIFYIDTELPESGIWVEKKIECEEEICSVELSELMVIDII